jgi:hypothetical protein
MSPCQHKQTAAVLPSNFGMSMQLGDLGFCWNLKTGDSTNIIFADVGPKNHLTEISVKAAQNLSLPSSPKTVDALTLQLQLSSFATAA